MKKILIAVLALILCAAALAEGTPAPEAAPEFDETTLGPAEDQEVEFAGTFTLTLPGAWQACELTPEDTASGVSARFSDGTRFLDAYLLAAGECATAQEYADSLNAEDPSAAAFVYLFGDLEFVCSVDSQAGVSSCAVVLPDASICALRFYPTSGDAEFADAILAIMNSCRTLEVAE